MSVEDSPLDVDNLDDLVDIERDEEARELSGAEAALVAFRYTSVLFDLLHKTG